MKIFLLALMLLGQSAGVEPKKVPNDALVQLRLLETQRQLAQSQMQVLQFQFNQLQQQEQKVTQEFAQLKDQVCKENKVVGNCEIDLNQGQFVTKKDESK